MYSSAINQYAIDPAHDTRPDNYYWWNGFKFPVVAVCEEVKE